MARERLFDYQPLPDGTPVKEVNRDGEVTGRVFVSSAWNTRERPAGRADGCDKWLNRIVVSETLDGANNGKALAAPTGTIASSSPSSRDVYIIHVDEDGSVIEEFTVPYVLVPKSAPVSAGLETAFEIWLSGEPFNPATTPVAELERTCVPFGQL